MFTKQHYEAVAEILKRQRRVTLQQRGALDEVISEFCARFEADSQSFDRDRFLKTTGYKYDPNPVEERLEELDQLARIAIDRERQ